MNSFILSMLHVVSMRLLACTSSKTLAGKSKDQIHDAYSSAPEHSKIGHQSSASIPECRIPQAYCPNRQFQRRRFTTFDQVKVRKQLCDLCGRCRVKQLCGRIVVAREGPGLSGWLVADGYAKIRYSYILLYIACFTHSVSSIFSFYTRN